MKCPYRKQTETVDGTTSEYYMECYGAECPYYPSKEEISCDVRKEFCKKVDDEYYIATHPYIDMLYRK